MRYLNSFRLAESSVTESLDPYSPRTAMTCYSSDPYPFRVFPQKGLFQLDFGELTLIYGGNGSGKSTLLNVISEKLKLPKESRFNKTPYFEDYLGRCSYSLCCGGRLPEGSAMIRSDDVFDLMLDLRALNEGVDNSREHVFDEYNDKKYNSLYFRLSSLEDLEELKARNRARHVTKSRYTNERVPKNLRTNSNGESAFAYFTSKIKENALYLLDEPENSLSPALQLDLARFIEDSVRFFGCQFVIATHSPFLLAMKNAEIYDLDASPVTCKKWTELENVRIYYDFFETHREEFC